MIGRRTIFLLLDDAMLISYLLSSD